MQWVVETPETSPSQCKNKAKTRRSHTKSRLGCRLCRTRRIKCDETHPQCNNCLKHGMRCSYSDDQQPVLSRTNSSASQSEPIETHEARAKILRRLREADIPKSDSASVYKQEDTAEILDHFLDASELWLGTPEIQRVAQSYGFKWAVDAPYLMHAMIAGSANHLHFKHPEVEKYDIAGNEHYALSLNAFRKQLFKPITRHNMDALIACSILHGPMAFWKQAHEECEELSFDWLRAIRGVPAIISSLPDSSWLEQSEWYTYSKQAGGSVTSDIVLPTDPVIRPWARDVTRRFEELCRVSVDDPDDSSPYVAALRHLSKLLQMNDHHRRASATLRFIGHLQAQYLERLEARDDKALLIFCYWHGLMCNVKQWWAEKPAINGCRRLCEVLDQSEDKAVKELLDWPKMQVGM